MGSRNAAGLVLAEPAWVLGALGFRLGGYGLGSGARV